MITKPFNFHGAPHKKPHLYNSPLGHENFQEWTKLDSINWDHNILVEVGCGQGNWIMDQAKHNPSIVYVGIEKTKTRSDQLIKNTLQFSLTNLITIRADAILLLDKRFPPQSINELYFFYPNPWPKKKQANKRFFVAPSFSVFHDRLKKGGTIYLASNIKGYVEETREFLVRYWNYEIIKFGPLDEKIEPRTLFEKKYKEQGDEIWELWVRKT